MEQCNLRAADLIPYIGHRGHVYDVLNRRRRLSLGMIRRLHDGLGIPADLLVPPVQLADVV
jgi:HTH-type transcriptional regulator / antitoxin HigA